jgi:membrane protein DedA with SNARE-associated domain
MFEWTTEVIRRLGYLGVASLTLLENIFPPVPSELVIPLAGFVAARGDLRLVPVILAASLGSLLGATLWYAVGRRIGEARLRRWVERHGKWLTLSPNDIDEAQRWFRRHGRSAVFIGRLVPGVRTFVSLPAGFSAMPIPSFLLYSALGTLVWTAGLAYAGALLEANFTAVGDYMNVATNAILGAIGVMVLWRYVRCWRAAAASAAHAASRPGRSSM